MGKSMYGFQRRRLLGSTTIAARNIICLGGRVEVILRAFHDLAVSPATLLLGGCRPRSYIGFDEQSDLEAAWLLNAKCVVSPWDRLGCLVFAMKLGFYTGTWISSDVFSPQSNAYSILCVENPIVLSYIIPAFVKWWKSHAKPLVEGEYFYGWHEQDPKIRIISPLPCIKSRNRFFSPKKTKNAQATVTCCSSLFGDFVQGQHPKTTWLKNGTGFQSGGRMKMRHKRKPDIIQHF